MHERVTDDKESEGVVNVKLGEVGLGWSPYSLNGSYGYGLCQYVPKGWGRFSPYF